MYYLSNYNSPLGKIVLLSDKENLCGLYFAGQKYFMRGMDDLTEENDNLSIFIKTKSELENYFSGKPFNFADIPLKIKVTPFRRKVLDIVSKIPYGKIMTYGDISKQISGKMSARATGGAIGHNPVLIIIPCHRVIASNGSLGGFAAGLEIKKELLKIENVI